MLDQALNHGTPPRESVPFYITDTLVIASSALMRLPWWDNEGGAGPFGSQVDIHAGGERAEEPHLTNAELVRLRIRVIALENLVLALLAEAPDRQIDRAREVAAQVSPRPGFTHHPLTIHAAAQMIALIERAGQLRDVTPP